MEDDPSTLSVGVMNTIPRGFILYSRILNIDKLKEGAGRNVFLME